MQLKGKNIIVTGGQGGIGKILSASLKEEGANITIIDRQKGDDTIIADLSDMKSLNNICEELSQKKVDILINLAGIMYFGHSEEQTADHISSMIRVNLEAPIRLTQSVIPAMLERKSGQIVNIGSVFDSLAFPHFSVYSATKAGLRNFSESIRREYSGKGIIVTHISPRAVKTSINSGLIAKLHQQTKTVNDPPEKIVKNIIKAIKNDCKNTIIGFPESIFVKINSICPSIIDNALISKRDIANEILNEKNNGEIK